MYGVTSAVQHGISARDYFAARAPAEIPDWFQIEDLRKRPELPTDGQLTQGQRFEFSDLLRGLKKESDVSIEALTHYRAYSAAKEDLGAWGFEHDKARYFAWRWHYADMMIEGRK